MQRMGLKLEESTKNNIYQQDFTSILLVLKQLHQFHLSQSRPASPRGPKSLLAESLSQHLKLNVAQCEALLANNCHYLSQVLIKGTVCNSGLKSGSFQPIIGWLQHVYSEEMENLNEVLKAGLVSDNEEVVKWTMNILREPQPDPKLVFRALDKHPSCRGLLVDFLVAEGDNFEAILEHLRTLPYREHLQWIKTVFGYVSGDALIKQKVLGS